jgi:lipoprotein-anchoring transpeptidase ErfK/SrfK
LEKNLILDRAKPDSGGCIRLKNEPVIDLFNSVKIGTYLNILEKI